MAAKRSAAQTKAVSHARRLEVVSESVSAAPALDRIIHERLRLGMVSALSIHDALSFAELKSILGASDGNLSVHARKLEDAGYVECRKGFDGRMPKTEYRLTQPGRRALERYLAHMEALIHAMKSK
jgi:DNA-binding transcriptional ArsR family regulator